MIVAPGTDAISIESGSPSREVSRDDVVRTVVMAYLGLHETGSDSTPFTEA
jgi:hypothetical protein